MAKIIRSKQVAKRVGQTLDELTKQLEAGNYDVAQLLRDNILDQVFDTPSPSSAKLSRVLDEIRDIYKSSGTNVENALSFLRDPKQFISKAGEAKTAPNPVKGKVKSKSAEVLLNAGKKSATEAKPTAVGEPKLPPIASDAARHYAALQGINAYLPYLPESQQKDILRVIKDRSMGIDEYLEKYGKSGPVSLHVKNAADTAGAVNTALATMKEKGRGRRTYDIHRLLEQAGARNTAYLYRLEDINRELSLIRDRLRSGNLSPEDAEKATKLYGQLRGEATRLSTNLKRTITAGKLPQDMAERFQRASESAAAQPKAADIRKEGLSQTKKPSASAKALQEAATPQPKSQIKGDAPISSQRALVVWRPQIPQPIVGGGIAETSPQIGVTPMRIPKSSAKSSRTGGQLIRRLLQLEPPRGASQPPAAGGQLIRRPLLLEPPAAGRAGVAGTTAAKEVIDKAATVASEAAGSAGKQNISKVFGDLLKKGGGALKKNKKAAIIAALIGAGILASQLLGQREEEQPEQLPPPTPLPPRAYNQNEAARQLMLAAYRQRLQEDSARRLASLGQTARMTPPMQPGTRALLQYVGALPNGE